MSEPTIIETRSKTGEVHQFACEAPEEDTVFGDDINKPVRNLVYRLRTQPDDEYFFEFTIKEEQDLLRVVMMNNHSRPEYTGKGIPEAMIVRLAKESGKRISSSSNQGCENEYRTVAASKIWQRLVARGLARYDETEDRFYVL